RHIALFACRYHDYRYLASFPTRRSSDLGAAMLEHGVAAAALAAYDEKLCPEISPLILRNRGAGPFGLLNLLDERCGGVFDNIDRSEEHTSELQSRENLVCRLLLEKKKTK